MNTAPTQCVLMMATLLAFAPAAMADTTVNYHGTLVHEPPCKFTASAPLDVSFGDIQIADVDGVKNEAFVFIPVECKDKSPMYIRHLGNAVSFDSAAVQTNIPDFGIRLLYRVGVGSNDFSPFPVGELKEMWTSGAVTTNLTVKAVPVKKTGVTLATGAFNGASTLQFEVP